MSSVLEVQGRDVRSDFDTVMSSLQTRYHVLSDAAITLEFKAEIARLGAKLHELSSFGKAFWQDDRDAALAPMLAHWVVSQIGLLEERLERRPLPFPNRFSAASRRAQVPA